MPGIIVGNIAAIARGNARARTVLSAGRNGFDGRALAGRPKTPAEAGLKDPLMRFRAALLAASLLAAWPIAGPAAAWAQAAADQGEPLPAGAPTDPYELSAWCYGAMAEYLEVYDRVKPDLKAIDRLFGTSVKNEAEPYHGDILAAREELKVLAGAVEAAEKASPQVISPRGAQAVKTGRSIWAPAEEKTRRELARAWLSWALPDACDTNARALAARSALLGQVLKYNAPEGGGAPLPPKGP